MDIVRIDGIPVYQATIDGQDTGMLRISLVDDPAVQSNFLAFAAQHKGEKRMQMYSVQNEEKRLVLGCVMRADFPIYRRDEKPNGEVEEYYIMFTADTIRTMAEKYLAENRQNEVNRMHQQGSDVDGVQMVQCFIKGDGLNPEGFDDIADGSLFAEFHITNDEVWDAVKDGTYKGFSLEGYFNLEPEEDEVAVEEIVEALDGLFSRVLNNNQTYKKMKKKGLLARLAAALVKLGTTSTDKGVLAWDGEDDIAVGLAVYIEDENGERTAAADGDYTTGDGVVIAVADGKVSEIREPEPPAAETAAAQLVETDKGKLEWDNEDEDLKEGDAVYITDEDGNRNPAPDGEYTTEDGKVISVVDGKVASISDPDAEVAAEKEQAKAEAMARIQKFEASYDEKYRKIADAIAGLVAEGEHFYIVEAGDDFAVASIYNEDDWVDKYFRYSVTWNEDGTANVSEPVEVKQMFVPVDFVSPFEKGDASEEEMSRVRAEMQAQVDEKDARIAELTAQVEQLSKAPAAAPAHEEFTSQAVRPGKTGNRGLDNLARIAFASAKKDDEE